MLGGSHSIAPLEQRGTLHGLRGSPFLIISGRLRWEREL
jgi:hypothetical protein